MKILLDTHDSLIFTTQSAPLAEFLMQEEHSLFYKEFHHTRFKQPTKYCR